MTTRRMNNGTTITLDGQYVIFDHPAAPADMRNIEAGRIINGCFQPAPFAEFAMRPETLRVIADLIEEALSA